MPISAPPRECETWMRVQTRRAPVPGAEGPAFDLPLPGCQFGTVGEVGRRDPPPPEAVAGEHAHRVRARCGERDRGEPRRQRRDACGGAAQDEGLRAVDLDDFGVGGALRVERDIDERRARGRTPHSVEVVEWDRVARHRADLVARAPTGLRLGELRALVVSDVELTDINRASIRVRATNAKNRREARLPLRPATATVLRDRIGKALPMARVFELYRWWPAATAIRDDLALAWIAYRDDAGRVVDFHSLRVTYATNLARSRVPLQLAQRLMRHSDLRPTSSIYTVLNSDDEREAVAALPDLDVAPPDVVRATGTEDAARAPASSDARVDAVFVAWSDLDERARDALLQRAKTLGRADARVRKFGRAPRRPILGTAQRLCPRSSVG